MRDSSVIEVDAQAALERVFCRAVQAADVPGGSPGPGSRAQRPDAWLRTACRGTPSPQAGCSCTWSRLQPW